MIRYIYKGDGDFLIGIPARDVNADELSADQIEAVEASGLYESTEAPDAPAEIKESAHDAGQAEHTVSSTEAESDRGAGDVGQDADDARADDRADGSSDEAGTADAAVDGEPVGGQAD